ncbi:High frequency lysogenization protein HflD-like protein [Bienertia sinuspersici]
MLGAGSLPSPSAPPLALKKPLIPLSLLLQPQTHKSNLSLLPQFLSNYSSLSVSGRTGFCLFAQKEEKIPTFEMEEIEGFEGEEDEFDFDDEDEDFDEEEDEEYDEDDEDMLPFHKMNASLEKKPRGFGEGKVYDTSVEDKLLQEIEQSIKAQIANINKLKNEPRKPKPNNELQEVFKGVPGGVRVRVNNLPKKRNIYRDLKSAFEGVPGIINISPVNSGNKKTRDPVCKGLAFVDFKSVADANSFLQMFSGKTIAFGKSEKPIKCEILKPLDASYDGYISSSEGSLAVLEEEEGNDNAKTDTQLQLREENELVKGLDGKYVIEDDPEKLKSIERIEKLESKLLARASLYEEELKSKKKAEVKDKPDKKPTQKANKKANLKPEKKPKLTIPGSAKKLKVREKAKLADVYSRYGKREASSSKET